MNQDLFMLGGDTGIQLKGESPSSIFLDVPTATQNNNFSTRELIKSCCPQLPPESMLPFSSIEKFFEDTQNKVVAKLRNIVDIQAAEIQQLKGRINTLEQKNKLTEPFLFETNNSTNQSILRHQNAQNTYRSNIDTMSNNNMTENNHHDSIGALLSIGQPSMGTNPQRDSSPPSLVNESPSYRFSPDMTLRNNSVTNRQFYNLSNTSTSDLDLLVSGNSLISSGDMLASSPTTRIPSPMKSFSTFENKSMKFKTSMPVDFAVKMEETMPSIVNLDQQHIIKQPVASIPCVAAPVVPIVREEVSLKRKATTVSTRRPEKRYRWTQEQDDALRQSVKLHNEHNWKAIASLVPGRTHVQCLQRWKKVLAPGLVKGAWSADEDKKLKETMAKQRGLPWTVVATNIPGRTAKQCRERWSLNLDPTIKRTPWTEEEDKLLMELHRNYGNRWSTIQKAMEGRTENAVKTRHKSLMRMIDKKGLTVNDLFPSMNIQILKTDPNAAKLA